MSAVTRPFESLYKTGKKIVEGENIIEAVAEGAWDNTVGYVAEVSGYTGKQEEKKQKERDETAKMKKEEEEFVAAGEQKKDQTRAEATAAKTAAKAKAKQTRKSTGTGRKSTLLTDTLGGATGELEETLGKKSLLGL